LLWFDTVKIRRLSHVMSRVRGTRKTIGRMAGDEFVERMGPDRAPKRPKSVVGMAKVRKSFAVKR
jgi:hypothetical protein